MDTADVCANYCCYSVYNNHECYVFCICVLYWVVGRCEEECGIQFHVDASCLSNGMQ